LARFRAAILRMSSEQPPGRFLVRARVDRADLDELEHVNNAVYLRWVQEAAVAHWRAIAPSESRGSILWVVVRHEIDYKAPAIEADELQVATWVGEATRITFERHTEILRARDGQLLVKARTLWCPIDAQTRRPTRVDPVVRALFSTGKAPA
jgi:acyl-CoA thioester hydrolase